MNEGTSVTDGSFVLTYTAETIRHSRRLIAKFIAAAKVDLRNCTSLRLRRRTNHSWAVSFILTGEVSTSSHARNLLRRLIVARRSKLRERKPRYQHASAAKQKLIVRYIALFERIYIVKIIIHKNYQWLLCDNSRSAAAVKSDNGEFF